MEPSEQLVGIGLVSAFLILSASPVFAYAGPGGVVGGVGALLGIIGTLLALLVGFIWYPLKALLNQFRDTRNDSHGDRPFEE